MHTECQPLPQSVAEGMLQSATRMLCDRSADSADQRDALTRQMVYSTLGFEPRDGLEYMIATLIFGHYHAILDAMHGLLQGQLESMKVQTRSGIIGLDRMLLAHCQELRLIRRRPLAHWAEDAKRQAEAGRAAATPAPAAPSPAAQDVPPPTSEPDHAEPLPVKTVPPAAATTPSAAALPLPVDPTPAPPPSLQQAVNAVARWADLAAAEPPAQAADASEQLPWTAEDEARFELHIAEFQQAVAAMTASIDEARGFSARDIAMAISGD
jgi:hypothetical protein